MARKTISVTHEEKSVKFPEFSSDDPLVYELFSKLSSDEYENSFNAMLHIGALALMEDRIQHLIDSAEKEIYPQLERFKLMFNRKYRIKRIHCTLENHRDFFPSNIIIKIS